MSGWADSTTASGTKKKSYGEDDGDLVAQSYLCQLIATYGQRRSGRLTKKSNGVP